MKMVIAMVALLLAQVSGAFSDASVEGSEAPNGMLEIDLTVRTTPGGVVVAHFVKPGDEQETVAMAEREPGLYGVVTEVAKADLVVVFEAVAANSYQSEPQRLTDLGLDRALLGVEAGGPDTTGDPEDGIGEEAENWGWLALAAGALSLSALAFWALSGGPRKGRHRRH